MPRFRDEHYFATRRMDYDTYLLSDEWQAKRVEKLTACKGVCQRCKKLKATQIHHKSYARLGNEKMSDLRALCAYCHRWIHGRQTDWDTDPILHDTATETPIRKLPGGTYRLRVVSAGITKKKPRVIFLGIVIVESTRQEWVGRKLATDFVVSSQSMMAVCAAIGKQSPSLVPTVQDTSDFIGCEFTASVSPESGIKFNSAK